MGSTVYGAILGLLLIHLCAGFEDLGCFYDYLENRTLPGLDSCYIPEPEELCNECTPEHPYCESAQSMTVDFCTDLCHRRGFLYSGLEAGNQCFCGNDFDPLNPSNGQPPDGSDCTEPCAGDSSQVCGGELRIIMYSNDEFMNCSTPINFSNGTVTPNQDVYASGTTVTLECNAGFYQVGPTDSYCWYSGVFSHVTKDVQPSCIRECEELTSDSITEVSRMVQYTGYFVVGDTITYTCSVGYEPNDGSVSTGDVECREDRLWAAELPNCSGVSCGDPGTPDQGVLTGDLFDFPNSVSYECNLGYTLDGSATRQCQSDKTWSGTLPSCIPEDCGNLDNITNGVTSYNDTTYGMSATYTCNVGYNLIGDMSRTCQEDGMWSGSSPICEVVSCGEVSVVEGVFTSGSDYTYNAVLMFFCDNGYNEVSGDNSITCQADGSWSGGVLVCEIVSCGEVSVGEGVFTSGSDYTYNAVLTFFCDNGYNEVSGDNSITCQADGSWSGGVLVCEIVSCGEVSVGEGVITSGVDYTYNAVLTFVCDNGYNEVSGDNSATCQADGSWSGLVFVCEIVNCGDPGTPADGEKTGGSVETYGSIVNYVCDTGYDLMGAQSITCQSDGTWSDSAPTCQIVTCGDPGTPTDGVKTGSDETYGSTVTYECNTGFNLIGSASVTCQSDRTWSDSAPTCQIVDCMHPGSPDGITVVVDETTYGAIVTYSCSPGYSISTGNDWRNCGADGLWTGDEPTCSVDSCGEPATPEYSIRTGGTYEVGGMISYECMTGYEQTAGNSTITCTVNSTWSGEPIVCSAVNCGDPGTPESGSRTGADETYGNTVNYECNTGYNLIGTASITCQSDGTWSDSAPICQKLTTIQPATTQRQTTEDNITTKPTTIQPTTVQRKTTADIIITTLNPTTQRPTTQRPATTQRPVTTGKQQTTIEEIITTRLKSPTVLYTTAAIIQTPENAQTTTTESKKGENDAITDENSSEFMMYIVIGTTILLLMILILGTTYILSARRKKRDPLTKSSSIEAIPNPAYVDGFAETPQSATNEGFDMTEETEVEPASPTSNGNDATDGWDPIGHLESETHGGKFKPRFMAK